MTRVTPGRATILALAAIAALGSLATQLIVPALPVMARDLVEPGAAVQRIISVYLAGLGVGQLVFGPLADRIGRRPVLLGGLLLFVLGSGSAALASGLETLLVARFVQALGGAAGIIAARVMVGDLFPPEEAAARQATLMSVILLSPAVAPVVGGALAQYGGWRPVFVLLALVGSANAVFALARFPESRRVAIHPRRALPHAYAALLRNRRFLGNALAIACGSAALYCFLAATPFLLAHDYGLGPRDTGLCLLLVAAASIGGTLCVARADGAGQGVVIGTLCAATGAALLAGQALWGTVPLAAFLVPMLAIGFGSGILGPSGIAQVIHAEPGIEGTAASLAGALQMMASALASGLIGQADMLHLGMALLALLALALAAALSGRVRRHEIGQPSGER